MKKILFILLIILTTSCGAKKSSSKSQEVKINTETKIESENKVTTDVKKEEVSNVKTEETKKTIDKGEVTIKETTYELIDKTKPGKVTTLTGVIELDNAKQTIKETIQKNDVQTDGVKKKDSIGSTKIDLKKVDENKTNVGQTDNSSSLSNSDESNRKQYNLFNSIWFYIITAAFIVIWFLYKRYRSKLPF